MSEEGLDGLKGDVCGKDKKANAHKLKGNLLAAFIMNGRR